MVMYKQEVYNVLFYAIINGSLNKDTTSWSVDVAGVNLKVYTDRFMYQNVQYMFADGFVWAEAPALRDMLNAIEKWFIADAVYTCPNAHKSAMRELRDWALNDNGNNPGMGVYTLSNDYCDVTYITSLNVIAVKDEYKYMVMWENPGNLNMSRGNMWTTQLLELSSIARKQSGNSSVSRDLTEIALAMSDVKPVPHTDIVLDILSNAILKCMGECEFEDLMRTLREQYL